jgi:Ni/Co efflux regulator RcnB
MKKIVSRILAVSMAAVMALSLASCGSNEKEGKDDVVSNESQVEASKVESDAGFQTIEEYLASDEIQSQLDTIRDSMSNDEVTVDIAAIN